MKYVVSLVIIFFISVNAIAQMRMDTTRSAAYLVDTVLAGSGARVGNVKLTGYAHGIAYVEFADSALIGIKNGILISTGKATAALGPNKSFGTTGINSDTSSAAVERYGKGDSYLTALAGHPTYDIMILEFDFVPFNNKISFNYCFASEEYLEYVGSEFNDIFTFEVSGENMPRTNLAVVPGSKDIVSVNSINTEKNKEYYVNNTLFGMGNAQVYYKPKHKGSKQMVIDSIVYLSDEKPMVNKILLATIEFDGITKKLTAECYVVPYKKYHFRIAIADVGDYILDSGVFLEGGSFTSTKDTTQAGFKEYSATNGEEKADSLLGIVHEREKTEKNSATISGNLTTKPILFPSDVFSISVQDKKYLNELAAYLLKNNSIQCKLSGHTDHDGSKAYNDNLSEKRVMTVYNYLIGRGVDSKQLNISFHAFELPISDNNTEGGKQKNRRVEVKFE